MAAPAYAAQAPFFGSQVPKRWRGAPAPTSRSAFGDAMVVAFLLAQCFDGVLTYVGVATFGIAAEANPIVSGMMTHLGHGLGLVGAKAVAALLGICLHLCEVHAAVALLTGLYIAVAVAPWTMILFF